MDEVKKIMEDLTNEYLTSGRYYAGTDRVLLVDDVVHRMAVFIDRLAYERQILGGEILAFTPFDVVEILRFVVDFPYEINREWLRGLQNDKV